MPGDRSSGARPPKGVADAYSSDAEVYEKTWAPVLRPHARKLIGRLPLAGAARVLDAGAGVGALLADLREAAPCAQIVGVDISRGMIARAPAPFPRAVMDVASLAFVSAAFDVAVLAFVLFHLPDPARAAREIHRVLRPGGSAGIITWDGEPRFPAHRAFMETLDAHGAATADRSFVNHEPVNSPLKMKRLLAAAGFGTVRCATEAFRHAYDVRGFIDLRTTRGSTARRFETLDRGRRERFIEDVRRRLAALRPADFVDESEMIVTVAARS